MKALVISAVVVLVVLVKLFFPALCRLAAPDYPVLMTPLGSMWLNDLSSSRETYDHRRFEAKSPEAVALMNWIQSHKEGWKKVGETSDPPGVEIGARVFLVDLGRDSINVYSTDSDPEDHDRYLSRARPLSKDECETLDKIVSQIRANYPIQRVYSFGKGVWDHGGLRSPP